MLIILGIFVFNQFNSGGSSREINFSTFTQLVDSGKVAAVVVERNNGNIEGRLRTETQVEVDGDLQTIRSFGTTAVITDSLLQRLEESAAQVRAELESEPGNERAVEHLLASAGDGPGGARGRGAFGSDGAGTGSVEVALASSSGREITAREFARRGRQLAEVRDALRTLKRRRAQR